MPVAATTIFQKVLVALLHMECKQRRSVFCQIPCQSARRLTRNGRSLMLLPIGPTFALRRITMICKLAKFLSVLVLLTLITGSVADDADLSKLSPDVLSKDQQKEA